MQETGKNFEEILIQAPAIWKQGITEDGLFFFDMDYIQGITLAEYIPYHGNR